MGILLDSNILIAAERRRWDVQRTLSEIANRFPGEPMAVSVLTLAELAHGLARADTPARQINRQLYLNDLIKSVPVHPVSAQIALRAGRLDGECTAKGIRIPLADLLIAVTALELGFGVGTSNLRHFHLIPGLRVVSI